MEREDNRGARQERCETKANENRFFRFKNAHNKQSRIVSKKEKNVFWAPT